MHQNNNDIWIQYITNEIKTLAKHGINKVIINWYTKIIGKIKAKIIATNFIPTQQLISLYRLFSI